MSSRKSASYSSPYAPRKRSASRAPNPPDRRSLSVLLVLLAAMAGLAAFGWLQSRHTALAGGVRLAVAAGTGAVERPGAGAPAPLASGQELALESGDTLRVSADGRAVLLLGAAGRIDLGPGTHVHLLELEQRPLAGTSQLRLALHAGSTIGRLGSASAGTSLIIETTAMSVASQSGVVLCQTLATNHAQVAVYEGSADVSMGEQSVQLAAGEGVDVQLGQPFVPIAVPPPAPTEVVIPRETAVAATATLTDREKTLFPKVLTPTRPGDPPPPTESAIQPTGDGTTEWYTVAKGDTLYSIARRYNVSWEAIWEANREILPEPEMLQVGQQLRIPSP
jgi:nucleoid-associated protein YgaU